MAGTKTRWGYNRLVMRVRRAQKAIVLWLAFALFAYSVPVQALASLCQPSACQMACCAGEATQARSISDRDCKSPCCGESSLSRETGSRESDRSNKCQCSVRPSKLTDPVAADRACAPAQVDPVAMDAAPITTGPALSIEDTREPGHLSGDGGPPGKTIDSPDLGRAPPVIRG